MRGGGGWDDARARRRAEGDGEDARRPRLGEPRGRLPDPGAGVSAPRRRPGAFEPEPGPEDWTPRRRWRLPDLLRLGLLALAALLLLGMVVLDLPLWMLGGKLMLAVVLVVAVALLRPRG